MSSMATFTFYDEIQISECPSNLYDLKQTIKRLYTLDDCQIVDCLISYTMNGEHKFIFKEEDYEKVIPIIEKIVIKIEISDTDKYLTIDPMIDEEYELYQLENITKKGDEKDKHIDEYNSDDYNLYENMEFEGDADADGNGADTPNSPNAPNGIKCNICDGEIQGIRYLCGVCQDFNMCEKCEIKEGMEHNHPLLKIRSPDLAPTLFKCKIKIEN